MLQVRGELWKQSYFCASFNDATCVSDYLASNTRIVDKFRIGKRIGMKWQWPIRVLLSSYLHRGTAKPTTQSGYLEVPVDWKLVQIVVPKQQSRNPAQKLNQKVLWTLPTFPVTHQSMSAWLLGCCSRQARRCEQNVCSLPEITSRGNHLMLFVKNSAMRTLTGKY